MQEAYLRSLLLDIRATFLWLQYADYALLNDKKNKQKQSKKTLESKAPHKIKLESIYIGGGTPNLLSVQHYERIFSEILRHTSLPSEITIEANPNSLQRSWCDRVAQLGVNRISLGVQSFCEKKLAFLEREHKNHEVYRALDSARTFAHKSIDMIYGTPFDNEATLLNDIQQAATLDIDHLSAYMLTLEEGSRFMQKYQNISTPLDVEKQCHLVRDILLDSGFSHYEVANFARPYKSLHNLAYWQNKEYLGCGSGAVGRIGTVRYMGTRDLKSYIATPLKKEQEYLTRENLALETLFLGLRSTAGVALQEVQDFLNQEHLTLALQEGKCALRNGRLYNCDFFVADSLALWLYDEKYDFLDDL